MSQLHLTATVAALLIVGVFGLTSYLLDGRPFHAPMPSAYWGEDADKAEFVKLDGSPTRRNLQPVAHRPR